jgi:hypothetical protein
MTVRLGIYEQWRMRSGWRGRDEDDGEVRELRNTLTLLSGRMTARRAIFFPVTMYMHSCL